MCDNDLSILFSNILNYQHATVRTDWPEAARHIVLCSLQSDWSGGIYVGTRLENQGSLYIESTRNMSCSQWLEHTSLDSPPSQRAWRYELSHIVTEPSLHETWPCHAHEHPTAQVRQLMPSWNTCQEHYISWLDSANAQAIYKNTHPQLPDVFNIM